MPDKAYYESLVKNERHDSAMSRIVAKMAREKLAEIKGQKKK